MKKDEGCGSTLNVHSAGSAFMEIPGRVHRVFNLGTEPVVFIWVEIVPSCHVPTETVFVTGPKCLGNCGKSKLEKISPCGEHGESDVSKSEAGAGGERQPDGITIPAQTAAPEANSGHPAPTANR